MFKYGFVVLNYMNYCDAIECVSSLLAIKRNDYKIIIVDNYSQNESIIELQHYFCGNEKVNVISAPANLGYSGGNNIGIKWLRDRSIDNIIIATSDTVLISEDILEIFDSLELKNVGIVGPSILSLDGALENPALIAPNIIYFANLFFYKQMKFLRNTLYKLFPYIELRRINSLENEKLNLLKKNSATDLSQPINVYMLHGAFYFLTKRFFNKIGLLDDNIFMYGEEDLLSWQCELNGLDRLFIPSISVLHKGGKCIESVYKGDKTNFVKFNIIKSRGYSTGKIRLFPFLSFLTKRRAGM
jgi:GT2 family glycosyltransferase